MIAMFCTSKERETCDVEKRGCEGCYYNKDGDYMNEEEILEMVDKFVDDERLVNKKGDYYKPYQFGQAQRFVYKEQYEAIQGLLDLYNQEKEKNKKLEERIESISQSYIKTMDDEASCVVSRSRQKKFYEKVIDMMAKDLVKVPTNDYMSETQQEIAHYMNRHLKEKKETIKQYYFKKARGEENEKS